MLGGKKTYIIAALVGLVSAAYAMKWIDENMYATLLGLLNAGGLAALRSGVTKSGPNQ